MSKRTTAAIKAIAVFPVIALMSTTAHAGSNDGNIQVKLVGTAVLPDGEIREVLNDEIGLPDGSQSRANDNVVPTVAIEYFLSDNFSIETIAGLSQHDVDGVGALAGAELVSDVVILPATVTAKFHFDLGNGIKPYVGAGPSYFVFIDEQPGFTAQTLGATRLRMNDELGFALQAGIDAPLNDNGLGLTVDVKRYYMRPTAQFFDATGAEILATQHRLDPWTISAGIAFRF